MGYPEQDNVDYVRGKAQWSVGIAALRRVRNLVDECERDDQFKKRTAKYVTACLILTLMLALISAVFFPAAIQNLLRSLS